MTFSIRLPGDLEQRLERLSKLTNRTKSFYVTLMLRSEIDRLEKMYLEVEVAKAAQNTSGKAPGERYPSYRSRPANDGGTYYLLPDDEPLLHEVEQSGTIKANGQ